MVAGHRLGKRLISFLPPEFGVLGGAQHRDTPKSPSFGGKVFDLGGGGASLCTPKPSRQGEHESLQTPLGVCGGPGLVTGGELVWGGSLTPHFVVCPPAKNSNVENLPPHILRLVYKEVSLLSSDPPDGIKLFPNEEDITDVQVTIEGPGKTPPPYHKPPP